MTTALVTVKRFITMYLHRFEKFFRTPRAAPRQDAAARRVRQPPEQGEPCRRIRVLEKKAASENEAASVTGESVFFRASAATRCR
jgi:hypothetical protein